MKEAKPNVTGTRDVKPNVAGSAGGKDEMLQLRVTHQNDGTVVTFRVKKNVPFEKIYVQFASRVREDMSVLRLLVDGQRIAKNQTPADLDLENGDEIESFIESEGS
mmetsp:Transcript_45080/g.110648  ORF Transcript_45080/g.110648 Transcript_45080/m.110648 type:complete len:106 (-) Transcript_45080:707-1024(-)